MVAIKYSLGSMLLALIAGLGMSGCGEAKELYNCTKICETANDCASTLHMDMDRTSCISQCEDAADRDEGFAETASKCQQCLEGQNECSNAFPCADKCAGVLPAMLWGEGGTTGGEGGGGTTTGGEGGGGTTTGGEGGGGTTTPPSGGENTGS